MEIKIIFSDIDGTFLKSDSRPSPRTAEAVRRVLAKNIPFVLVSARMPEAIYPLTDAMGLRLPIVSASGGLVRTEAGETLFDKRVELADAREIIAVIESEYPEATLNYYAGDDWYVREIDARVQKEIDITSARPELYDFEKALAVGSLPSKLLVMAEPELCERMERELSARFPSLHVVRSAPFLLEIMDQSISKATGLNVLLKHYGFTKEDALAFGDNYNDVEMLELAATSVAMGNAPEKIKASATFTTLTNDEDGLAAFLEEKGII